MDPQSKARENLIRAIDALPLRDWAAVKRFASDMMAVPHENGNPMFKVGDVPDPGGGGRRYFATTIYNVGVGRLAVQAEIAQNSKTKPLATATIMRYPLAMGEIVHALSIHCGMAARLLWHEMILHHFVQAVRLPVAKILGGMEIVGSHPPERSTYRAGIAGASYDVPPTPEDLAAADAALKEADANSVMAGPLVVNGKVNPAIREMAEHIRASRASDTVLRQAMALDGLKPMKDKNGELGAVPLGEGDVHAQTAGKIFDKDPKDVTEDERRAAQKVNFGMLYGLHRGRTPILPQGQEIKAVGLTPTGRTPEPPEEQELPDFGELERQVKSVDPLLGTGAVKLDGVQTGRVQSKTPNECNGPKHVVLDMDYATIERRILAQQLVGLPECCHAGALALFKRLRIPPVKESDNSFLCGECGRVQRYTPTDVQRGPWTSPGIVDRALYLSQAVEFLPRCCQVTAEKLWELARTTEEHDGEWEIRCATCGKRRRYAPFGEESPWPEVGEEEGTDECETN